MSETKNLKLFKHEEPLGTNNNKFDIDKALNQNWDKVDEYVEKVNTEITNLQNNKVDKEEGKGLSTNDFTNDDKKSIHNHKNKNVLDLIDEEKVKKWDKIPTAQDLGEIAVKKQEAERTK